MLLFEFGGHTESRCHAGFAEPTFATLWDPRKVETEQAATGQSGQLFV